METTTPLLPEDSTTRQYSKVNVQCLADYLNTTNTSHKLFAGTIGVSSGCVSNWLRAGEMPQYIGLLVKHLQAKHDATLTTSINVYGTHENIDAVMPLLARFDLNVNNR